MQCKRWLNNRDDTCIKFFLRYTKKTDSPPSHGVSSGLQSKADKKAEIAYPSIL